MGRPQISVIKRQREQAKRERQQVKAAKRAERKIAKANGEDVPDDDILSDEDLVSEQSLDDDGDAAVAS